MRHGLLNISNNPSSEINNESLMVTMDRASLAGSVLALIFLPIAILSGNVAADGQVESALLYNKFVYSGLALGFWSAFVIGRIGMGPGLWEEASGDSPVYHSGFCISDDFYGIIYRR